MDRVQLRLIRRGSVIGAFLVVVLSLLVAPVSVRAQDCPPLGTHTVQAGETLSSIAARYGVTADVLAQRNGLTNPNLIYVGQQLTIGSCAAPAAPAVTAAPVTPDTTHVVQPGETLSSIAQHYGVTWTALAQLNGLANPSLIYVGQQLRIPVSGSASPAPSATPQPNPAGSAGKRIEINLSTQWLYAYEGDQLFVSSGVSTGRPGWDTPPGTFAIYAKYSSQTMSGSVGGESWYVPNVPHVMYFYLGDALHGTYWHNSFGTGARLSHGCVNLPLDIAAQLYAWAPIGTPVWVHW